MYIRSLSQPNSAHTPHSPRPPLTGSSRKHDDPARGVAGRQTELVGEYAGATWNPTLASPRYPEADPALNQAQVGVEIRFCDDSV